MTKASQYSLNSVPEAVLEVTDDSGKPLLHMPQGLVIRQKLRHKGVLVCLRNMQGHIFLFKSQTPLPGAQADAWTPAVFGRVPAGESRHATALRLLEKELGIASLELFEKGTFIPKTASQEAGNIAVTLFLTARTSAIPRLSALDAQEGMFVDREEFRAIIRDYPHMLTPLWSRALPHFFSS